MAIKPPNPIGYVKNVLKETKQTATRASNALSKKDREMYEKKYGRKIDIKIGNSKVKEQVGQLGGALFLGRRYNEQGKQITAPVRQTLMRVKPMPARSADQAKVRNTAKLNARAAARGNQMGPMKPMPARATAKGKPMPKAKKK